MKILRYLLPSLLPLVLITSVSAQKAEGGCSESAAKSSCCDSGAVAQKGAAKDASSQIAVFQKLNAADKKAVAEAFARLNKDCPYGSRLGKTIVMLDKLYAEASQNLVKVAQHENCDATLSKDLMAEVKVIGDLRAINAKGLKTANVIMASNSKASKAGGCCGAETATAKATAITEGGCGDEAGTAKTEGCCDEPATATATAKAQGGCCSDETKLTGASVVFANSENLATSWSNASKDLKKMDPKVREQLQADLKLLSSNGLQVPQQAMASIQAQAKKIGKAHAGLSCSTSGLVKKHEAQITAGSFTSKACDESSKALASVSALLKATNAALNPPKVAGEKAEGSCCDTAKASKIGQ